MPELIDLTIPPADVAAIQTLLTSLEAAMPFLVGLSADQVKALFKLGPRSEAFVMKALIAAELHPRLLPRKSPLAAMQRDAALRETLRPIRTRVATLLELIDGTMMLAGADLMKNASVIYRVMKISGKGAGVEDLVEDLGQRFTKRRKPTSEESTPAKLVNPELPAEARCSFQTSPHPPALASQDFPSPMPTLERQPGNAWLQPGYGDGCPGTSGSAKSHQQRSAPRASHAAATLEHGVPGAGAIPKCPIGLTLAA